MKFLKRVRSVVWNRQFFLAQPWCDICENDGHDWRTCKIRSPNLSSKAQENAEIDNPGAPVEQTQETEPLYGLAPYQAQAKDLICILVGCTVPVVLRPHELSDPDETYYELIGEAFVYGKMDGEALAGLDRDKLDEKLQWFTLK